VTAPDGADVLTATREGVAVAARLARAEENVARLLVGAQDLLDHAKPGSPTETAARIRRDALAQALDAVLSAKETP
jgi:hypothetical protein